VSVSTHRRVAVHWCYGVTGAASVFAWPCLSSEAHWCTWLQRVLLIRKNAVGDLSLHDPLKQQERKLLNSPVRFLHLN